LPYAEPLHDRVNKKRLCLCMTPSHNLPQEPNMKTSLQPGISLVRRIKIEKDKTISFMGEEGRVYGTPFLIGDIEYACRDLILQHADLGEDSVGTEVAIKHLAPTLPGSIVEITVIIEAVEGRKVTFSVAAKDEIDTISAGSHRRFVVDKTKTFERLNAKAAKLRGA
jgi:fluoroacetyl-CoA thioesterase